MSGKNSYHGYSTTDHYRIDPRFGTNELYRELVSQAHSRGLKVIFDHISNHIGVKHPWLKNLPAKGWINGTQKRHLSQKHYLLSISDPHADAAAENMLKTFWFVDAMPDLNQTNPLLASYLIQNTLWWIEYSGIDGIREDTYPYADQAFLANWAKAIRDEYPDFNIVGEVWAVQPGYLAQFQQESKLPRDFETHLPSMMDHELYAQDFLYSEPDNLVVFLDNHDISRAIFHAKGDIVRFKLAFTVMMMSRGIPQILYGTEIGMTGGESHVELRADFPGGFPNSTSNAFTDSGRTAQQRDFFNFCQKILRLRKKHPALSEGKMIHYAPTWNNDTYKVLRIQEREKILIIANGNSGPIQADLSELQSHFKGITKLRELQSDKEMRWTRNKRLTIPAMSVRIFKLLDSNVSE